MSADEQETGRTSWLTIALACGGTVLGYRLAGGILTTVFPGPGILRWGILVMLPGPSFVVLVGMCAGLGLAFLVCKLFQNRSRRATKVALGVVLILAVFPVHVGVSTQPVVLSGDEPYPPAHTQPPQPARVSPVSLQVRLLEGEEFGTDVIIDESNVADASYQMNHLGRPTVRLKLDEEGSKAIERTTENERGKQLAIFVDGKLEASPVIRTRISNGRIHIPGDFDRQEAERIAAGIQQAAEQAKAQE